MKWEAFVILTELQAKSAKGRDKPYMIRDDRGLYLRVDPSGRKYWILRYWEARREHQLSLGPYPLMGLKEARIKRDEIQAARLKGQSPALRRVPVASTMGEVIPEWLTVRMAGKAPRYVRTLRYRLDKYIIPALGARPLDGITSGEVLRLCRHIEAEGHPETARRVRSLVGQIFRFAIAAGMVETDPTAALAGALQPRTERHFATMTAPHDIRLLVRSIAAYPYPLLRHALVFSVLTFARPGEVRHAEWSEIRGDVWDIPPGKMKMRRRHLVPLSRQAVEVVEALREMTGSGRWLFPSARGNGRPMSENAARVALRALGYTKDQITPHGFRAMASTILNEHGFDRDVIERQLAHVQGGVRAAYNHAEYLEERRRMMQWWADWLEGADV